MVTCIEEEVSSSRSLKSDPLELHSANNVRGLPHTQAKYKDIRSTPKAITGRTHFQVEVGSLVRWCKYALKEVSNFVKGPVTELVSPARSGGKELIWLRAP